MFEPSLPSLPVRPSAQARIVNKRNSTLMIEVKSTRQEPWCGVTEVYKGDVLIGYDRCLEPRHDVHRFFVQIPPELRFDPSPCTVHAAACTDLLSASCTDALPPSPGVYPGNLPWYTRYGTYCDSARSDGNYGKHALVYSDSILERNSMTLFGSKLVFEAYSSAPGVPQDTEFYDEEEHLLLEAAYDHELGYMDGATIFRPWVSDHTGTLQTLIPGYDLDSHDLVADIQSGKFIFRVSRDLTTDALVMRRFDMTLHPTSPGFLLETVLTTQPSERELPDGWTMERLCVNDEYLVVVFETQDATWQVEMLNLSTMIPVGPRQTLRPADLGATLSRDFNVYLPRNGANQALPKVTLVFEDATTPLDPQNPQPRRFVWTCDFSSSSTSFWRTQTPPIPSNKTENEHWLRNESYILMCSSHLLVVSDYAMEFYPLEGTNLGTPTVIPNDAPDGAVSTVIATLDGFVVTYADESSITVFKGATKIGEVENPVISLEAYMPVAVLSDGKIVLSSVRMAE